MRVIHVETRRVASQDENMQPVYEKITQKLADGDVWKQFLAHYKVNRYTEAKVVAVYDFEHKTKEKDGKTIFDKVVGDFVEDENVLAKYSGELEAVIEQSKIKPAKNLLEEEKQKNAALEARLAKLEEAMLKSSKKEAKEDSSELDILKEEAKELGISLRGLKTKESIQAKIDEVKN